MRKLIFIIYLSLSLTSALTLAWAGEGLNIGSKAPNLIGRTMDGKLFRLKKLDVRPKVINFFWVGCVPCQQELPELGKIEKSHPDIHFLAVHTESIEKEKITAFLNGLPGAPSNIILGNVKVMELFKFHGLPHTVVLDGDNIVRLALAGYTEENMKRLKSIIAELK